MKLYIYRNGQQTGPLDENDVLEQLRTGRVSPDDLGIREGESNWVRLGDIFAGRFHMHEPPPSFAPPQNAASGAAGMAAVPKASGGCRKPLGWAVPIIGLLMFLVGGLVAVATPYGYATMTCDTADEKKVKVDDLMKKHEAAKGRPDEIAVRVELERELESYKLWNESCGRELSTKRMFQVGSIAVALFGFLLFVIGFFIRRVRSA
jgi:hypothetical protein